MPTLLHLDSSPTGQDSISRRLTAEFAQRWRHANPNGEVLSRDLAATAIPVIGAEWIAANLAPAESRTPRQKEILALSTQLTGELLTADEYVIGIPMHNWGPSSSFKLWADQVVRFGETVAVTPSGPRGTLGAKQVTFCLAAGRNYDTASGHAATNHLEPWLRTFFGSLGVVKMRFIFADGAAQVKYGTLDRSAYLAPYIEAVQSLFAAVPAS